MDNQEQMALALSIVEVAVQDMAEKGVSPMAMSVALAFHMNRQVDLAMPTEHTATLFKESLIA